jgi:hypothetical protein
LLSAIVGSNAVLQHTPCWVMVELLSEVIVPPLIAVTGVIEEAIEVVKTGIPSFLQLAESITKVRIKVRMQNQFVLFVLIINPF